MKHAAPSAIPSSVVDRVSHRINNTGTSEMSCRIAQPRRGRDDELSELVAKALWRSFPEEHSVEGVAEAAREYFRDKQGQPISKRTIKYWLQGETLPSAAHLLTLAMMQPRLFISHILGGEA